MGNSDYHKLHSAMINIARNIGEAGDDIVKKAREANNLEEMRHFTAVLGALNVVHRAVQKAIEDL